LHIYHVKPFLEMQPYFFYWTYSNFWKPHMSTSMWFVHKFVSMFSIILKIIKWKVEVHCVKIFHKHCRHMHFPNCLVLQKSQASQLELIIKFKLNMFSLQVNVIPNFFSRFVLKVVTFGHNKYVMKRYNQFLWPKIDHKFHE
jgi:hypothetical protein